MRVMKTDNAVDVWPDAALKNFIFYIIRMYEFSHNQGHSRSILILCFLYFVRCGSFATETLRANFEQCPVRSVSDQNVAARRMTRNATSEHIQIDDTVGCDAMAAYKTERIRASVVVVKERGIR
jgi:hypothetical protein